MVSGLRLAGHSSALAEQHPVLGFPEAEGKSRKAETETAQVSKIAEGAVSMER